MTTFPSERMSSVNDLRTASLSTFAFPKRDKLDSRRLAMLSSVSRGDEDVDGGEDPPLLVDSSTSFEALVPIELRAPCFPSGSMMDSLDTRSLI